MQIPVIDKPFNPTLQEAYLLQLRTERRLRSIISRQLEPFHLTMMEWLLLGVVKEARAGITLTAIAQALEVSRPQVTALMHSVTIKKLVKQKLRRADRRSRLAVLTNRGQHITEEIDTALAEYLQSWHSHLSADQTEAYLRFLQFIGEPPQSY